MMALVRLCVVLAVTVGCAGSRPQGSYDDWVQRLPFGGSKAEVDDYFALRDNQTGAWQSSLIRTEVTADGRREVYRYLWSNAPGYVRYQAIRTYDVTYLNDQLVGFQIGNEKTPPHFTFGAGSAPSQTNQSGMSFLCKDAISRGDQGGIFVHCN